MVFNAVLGWHSTATYGSILSYIGYWLVVAVTLVYTKWKEGRMTVFRYSSTARKEREARKINNVGGGSNDEINTTAVLDRKDSGSESEDEKNTAASNGAAASSDQREEGQFITEEKVRA